MEILVCIKQVPDDSAEIHLAPETGLPALDKVVPVVNAFDTYALEMAARLKEENGGQITVFTWGHEKAKDALKSCLAVGADHAFIWMDEGFKQEDRMAEFPTKTRLIEMAVRQIEAVRQKTFDLIFCGKETTDWATGQTGVQLACQMNIGCITGIIDLSINELGILAKQETEDGYRIIESYMPCLVTVAKPDYDPRYPTIKSKMAARKIPIAELNLKDLGTTASSNRSIVGIHEPTKKKCGIKVKEETFAETAKKAVAMMAEAKLF